MKKITIILATIAVVACSKTEVNYETTADAEIVVAPVARTLTKAAIADAKYPETNHISLFAYHAPEVTAKENLTSDSYSSFNKQYLYDTEYYFSGTSESSTKIWSGLNASYYWPITGSLVFAGYSLPEPEEGNDASTPIGTSVSYDLLDDKLEIKGYTQSTDLNKAFDFLYFGRTSGSFNNRRNGEPITLIFQHALSWIQIMAKGSAATTDWKITDITLKSVNTKGDFTYTGTATGNTPKVSWDVKADNGDIKVYTGNKPISPSDYEVVENVTNGLIVIPQGPKKLYVTVSYMSPANDDIEEIVEIDLAEYTTSWEAGKKYIYRLEFDPKKITVEPQVQTWPDPPVTTDVNSTNNQ